MTIDELLGEIHNALRPYQHGKYHLIDISRLPQELVDADKSSLSALMQLERAKTLDDAERVGQLLRLLLDDLPLHKNTHFKLAALAEKPYFAKNRGACYGRPA